MWDGQMPRGIIGWKANARPPEWKVRENAPLLPGGMGTAGNNPDLSGFGKE